MDIAQSDLNSPGFSSSPLEYSRLAEEKFQNMIAEVEDYAILLLDTSGIILSWNKGAEKIKGYKAGEIVGKSFKLFYPPEDIFNGFPEKVLKEATELGKANHEGWRLKKDGTRFWGNITITALHKQDGQISGFLKLTRDLTDKKVAEDRIYNMLEELQLKNEELKRDEEKYHKMISQVQDYAIILLDPEGKILDWNKGAEKLKGYASGEIIGKNFRLFYPHEDKKAHLPERLLNDALTKGSVIHEGYRIRKDGTRFWGSVAITALHDEQGKVIGFSKVTKDLSDKKIAEDKLAIFTQELQLKNEDLRRSEEQYHKMIAEVQDYAILLMDTKGIIQNWNAGAQLIKGYSANEIVGKNFRIFYTDEDLARNLPDQLLREAEEKGKAMSEGWRKRKDGTKFWGSIVITALHDSKGAVIGFSKVTRDLTQRKNAEELIRKNSLALELKNRELEKLNAELSSFAYVVSHDLKEPIRKIQVFAGRQLELNKSMDQIKEFSEKIILSASRMQKLMDSLISWSKISLDSNEELFETADLNQILEDVESDLEIIIAEKQGHIHSEQLPLVWGISFQLHQLFLNLLSNALKFTQAGKTPVISISTVSPISGSDIQNEKVIKSWQYAKVSFSDNGIGFEPDQRMKIFDLFSRINTNNESGGTGIGLAIVKKVVENHNGFIRAEGNPGEGARFDVYLPIAG